MQWGYSGQEKIRDGQIEIITVGQWSSGRGGISPPHPLVNNFGGVGENLDVANSRILKNDMYFFVKSSFPRNPAGKMRNEK